jgi:D-ornithine 4,5-aminomutase subunit beta
VALRTDGPLREQAREITERAVLFLEEIVAAGGYYGALSAGEFIDSGEFPERSGDGMVRDPLAGVGAGTVVRREPGYGAPVCSHFGDNVHVTTGERPCAAYGGCTLCEPSKIVYIDELDQEDNVERRLAVHDADRRAGLVRPEVEQAGDGIVCVTLFVPASPLVAEAAALELARHMGLQDPQVINRRVMHPAEGSLFDVKGVLDLPMRVDLLPVVTPPSPLAHDEIEAFVRPRRLRVVAATVGEDEHSVGLREILDIKHGGIERYGFVCRALGTSVPVDDLLVAAIDDDAQVVLVSTILTHGDVHRRNMQRLHELARDAGIRERLILVAGGTQVTDDLARACGMDAGFGRGTTGQDVASFVVRRLRGDPA